MNVPQHCHGLAQSLSHSRHVTQTHSTCCGREMDLECSVNIEVLGTTEITAGSLNVPYHAASVNWREKIPPDTVQSRNQRLPRGLMLRTSLLMKSFPVAFWTAEHGIWSPAWHQARNAAPQTFQKLKEPSQTGCYINWTAGAFSAGAFSTAYQETRSRLEQVVGVENSLVMRTDVRAHSFARSKAHPRGYFGPFSLLANYIKSSLFCN